MKTTLVLKKWLSEGTQPPAKFYLTNLYGDYIFLHADSLKDAKEWGAKHYPTSKVMSCLLGHKQLENRPYPYPYVQ